LAGRLAKENGVVRRESGRLRRKTSERSDRILQGRDLHLTLICSFPSADLRKDREVNVILDLVLSALLEVRRMQNAAISPFGPSKSVYLHGVGLPAKTHLSQVLIKLRCNGSLCAKLAT
jgi:hypothetical protein